MNNRNTARCKETKTTTIPHSSPPSRALTAQPAGEGKVFGLDSDALGVDRGEVGVLEERDEVRLGRLLERHDRGRLEAQVCLFEQMPLASEDVKRKSGETNLEVLRDFTNESLERELADEELGRLLVPTDLTKSDGTRPEAVGLLDTAGRGLKCKLGRAR